jgi:hypothetical protein
MRVPTAGRFLSDAEWTIVTGVFGDTLPSRWRILVTNGSGGGDAAFTIPTSAISMATIPAAVQAALSSLVVEVLGGRDGWVARQMNRVGSVGAGSMLSTVTGMVNLGYIMSIGPTAYPDLSRDFSWLLVHETAHVWQGKNSRSANTYVNNSIMHQCRASIFGAGRGAAYDFTPGQPWSSYNVEQQARIIDLWFHQGQRSDHPSFPYIRDYVRRGRT